MPANLTSLRKLAGFAAAIAAWAAAMHVQQRVHADELTGETFGSIARLIKPQADESLWRHVPWETSLQRARKRAAAQGKPLLIWSGGGSAPLGGC